MRHNLLLYCKMLDHLCQWLPDVRITRLRTLSLLISGIYLRGSVHLSKIVSKWPCSSRQVSLEQRLRRFLCNKAVDVRHYYEPLVRHLLAGFSGQDLVCIIDCTNIGFSCQMLSISIAYRKRALPLCFRVYAFKKGRLKARCYIAMCRYVQDLLPADNRVVLVADSGFQDTGFFRWLEQQGWPYIIRLRGNTRYDLFASTPQALWRRLDQAELCPGGRLDIEAGYITPKQVYGPVHLVAYWKKEEEEPWYLVSNLPQAADILRYYRRRMHTEQLYGDLKKHGFHLADTHLRDRRRIERLVLAACYVFVWLITLGSRVIKTGQRPWVDRKERRDKSVFRIGWDYHERLLSLGLPIKLHFHPY